MSTQTENCPDSHEHTGNREGGCGGGHAHDAEPSQREGGCDCGGHPHEHADTQEAAGHSGCCGGGGGTATG